MSETNSAYATSGVHQRVRLAHAERVAYTEVGSFSTNLNNLRAGAAGLNTVPALRNVYTADLVTMFVRPAGADACGIAFIMTTVTTGFAPNGYSVVDSPCSSPNGTLAHEFGHNMGLRHDWYMDRGVTPFTYAHGYVNLTARFRTIMAYADACASQSISCTRLLAFSNPDLTYLGQPGGVPGGTNTSCPTGNALNMSCDADERRALNDTAFSVANFREFSIVRPPSIRAHPQNQSVPRDQALTLRVEVEGLAPFTYQWYRGAAPTTAQPIAGATGPTYTFVPGGDGVWFERWFYWVQVSNAIGPVNSFTATVTLLQPGADSGSPQRGLATPDTTRTPAPNSGAPSTARPRARAGAPVAPTAPSVVIAQPGSAVPRAFLPLPGASEDDGRCSEARRDALIAWAVLSRPAVRAMTMTDALVEMMRALRGAGRSDLPELRRRAPVTAPSEPPHVGRRQHPLQRASLSGERIKPAIAAPLRLGRIVDELNCRPGFVALRIIAPPGEAVSREGSASSRPATSSCSTAGGPPHDMPTIWIDRASCRRQGSTPENRRARMRAASCRFLRGLPARAV